MSGGSSADSPANTICTESPAGAGGSAAVWLASSCVASLAAGASVSLVAASLSRRARCSGVGALGVAVSLGAGRARRFGLGRLGQRFGRLGFRALLGRRFGGRRFAAAAASRWSRPRRSGGLGVMVSGAGGRLGRRGDRGCFRRRGGGLGGGLGAALRARARAPGLPARRLPCWARAAAAVAARARRRAAASARSRRWSRAAALAGLIGAIGPGTNGFGTNSMLCGAVEGAAQAGSRRRATACSRRDSPARAPSAGARRRRPARARSSAL